MSPGQRCHGVPPNPSGHSQICHSDKFFPARPEDPAADPSDYSGPFRNHFPPGDRGMATGEREWGDVPYLPAYVDPMYPIPCHATGPVDNLYARGPFFEGVSETHDSFCNRAGIVPRKYHTFQKHHIEPGMKNDRSITYTDFSPPYPMAPPDKTPCLKPPEGPTDYVLKPARFRPNVQPECIPRKDPEMVFVEPEYVRDFGTEYSESYVCFLKEKKPNPLLDLDLDEGERYQRYLKCTHQNCFHGVPGKTIAEPPNRRHRKCFSRLTNGEYPNGYLILPHDPATE